MSETPPGAESYAGKTVRNVAWLGSTQLIRQGLSIATTIVVARFLSPAEFGIFAMTLFINEIAQLFIDFGVGAALVQRARVDQRLLSTCFWLSLGVAVVGAGVVVAVGPAAAAYFKQPQIAQLLFASGANLAISGLAIVPQALLARRLEMPAVALATTVGSLTGAAAAIALAVSGAGVWTLVLQPLVGTAMTVVLLWKRAGWLPSFVFERAELGSVLRFSAHLLMGNVLQQLTRNLQQIILAPVMGASAVGLLVMAQTVAWLPVAQFTSAAVRAIQPVFSRLQDSPERLTAGLLRVLGVVSFLAIPTLAGLGFVADDLMPIVFGEQWRDSWPLVSVMCVLAVVQCVVLLTSSTLTATGRVDLTAKTSFATFVFVGVALLALRHSSLVLVTIGLATAYGLALALTLVVTLRTMTVRLRDWFGVVGPTIACSAFMGACMLATKMAMAGVTPILRLVALVLEGAVVYLAVAWFFNRRSFDEVLNIVRRRV